MAGIAINIRSTENGWLVEVWRGREKRVEFVFSAMDEMLEFVRRTAEEAR